MALGTVASFAADRPRGDVTTGRVAQRYQEFADGKL
jgi:hypothetical protein